MTMHAPAPIFFVVDVFDLVSESFRIGGIFSKSTDADTFAGEARADPVHLGAVGIDQLTMGQIKDRIAAERLGELAPALDRAIRLAEESRRPVYGLDCSGVPAGFAGPANGLAPRVILKTVSCVKCAHRKQTRGHGECWDECGHPSHGREDYQNILWGCQEQPKAPPVWCPLIRGNLGDAPANTST